MKIDPETIRTLGTDLLPGKQIHINHDKCPAGRDIKKRLYIKRNENGILLAYCHHCGSSGSHAEKFIRYAQAKRGCREPADNCCSRTPSPEQHRVYFVEQFNDRGRAESRTTPERDANNFIEKAVSLTEEQKKTFWWDSKEQALGLPIKNRLEIVGVQWRYFGDYFCKYLTNYYAGNKLPHYDVAAARNSDTLVIVEDILSAMCVNTAGCDSMALLTSSTKLHRIYPYIQAYKSFVVWLDNDNRQVLQDASKLKRILEPFGEVQLIRTRTDPKHYSLDILQEILT